MVTPWTSPKPTAIIRAMERHRAGPLVLAASVSLAVACQPPTGPASDSAAESTGEMTDSGPESTKSLSFEDVATRPFPGTSVPRALRFSPDDSMITYLDSADQSLTQQLYAFDPATGESRQVVEPPGGGNTEENLSREEKLRRERMRMHALGVTRYAWPKKGNRLLVPITGDIYVQDGLDAELRLVVDTEGKPGLDPRFSPDGEKIAYVHDDELMVVPAAGGTPKQLTTGARGTGKTHGLAEYIAQEEMGRYHGFWWSGDAEQLAFTEVDETHIPMYRIMHQGKDAVGDAAQEDHGYPFAGAENAKVRLGVVSASGGKTTWMDLGDAEYLARVGWMPDGRLAAQVQNRDQTRLDLIFFDPRTGKGETIISEKTEVWINLNRLFEPLDEVEGEAAGGFLWGSERSGFQHLYLYSAAGELIRPLTQGEWMVDSLVEVDQKNKKIYFTATKDDARERHLYEVGFSGGEPRRITKAAGMHGVVIDHAYERYIDIHSSIDSPPKITLRSLADDSELAVLYAERDPRIDRMQLTPPRLVTIESRDGVKLHGAIYEPPRGEGGDEARAPYRTMVSVYGGPHAQRVTNSWGMTVDMRAQFLRSRGFLVFKLDNRGSARRGLEFEGAIKHDMGNIEVADQVDGVDWLVSEGLADKQHVGIYGWSYGGYMSAMALARAPDTFGLAVSGAPVTHWDGYDTHYTERYMGTPQNNEKGYEVSAVMHHLENMRGDLMLVHGLIDENVHFRHTARLINGLIAARKDYELLLFPNERHSPRALGDRVYMEQRIFDFIDQNL